MKIGLSPQNYLCYFLKFCLTGNNLIIILAPSTIVSLLIQFPFSSPVNPSGKNQDIRTGGMFQS